MTMSSTARTKFDRRELGRFSNVRVQGGRNEARRPPRCERLLRRFRPWLALGRVRCRLGCCRLVVADHAFERADGECRTFLAADGDRDGAERHGRPPRRPPLSREWRLALRRARRHATTYRKALIAITPTP